MKPRHVFVAGASILPASYRQSVQFYDEINWLTGKAWSDRSAISDQGVPMLSAHITSFFNLIRAQLEETSRGVASIHHFHNVQCGIENILCLLEYNNDVVDTVSRTLGLAHSDWRDSTAACISLTKAGRSCAIPSRANERISSLVEKADRLSRRASSYITRHGLISSKINDGDVSEDADRLRAAHEALAGFCFAVEPRHWSRARHETARNKTAPVTYLVSMQGRFSAPDTEQTCFHFAWREVR